MGRATIVGGGTDGLFTVSLDYGVAERDALVADKSARIADLTAQIADQADRIDAATAAKNLALENLNAAIQAFAVAEQAEPGEPHEAEKLAVDNATIAARHASATEAALKVPRDLLKAARKSLQREVGYLQSAIVSATQQAWCVDLTEDASGAVATVDVPGETTAIMIAPGCRAPTSVDGRMLAREVMSPAQAFYNAAILPGWQKWKPQYRKGTITSINKNADLASVALDAATSSALGLGVNQASSLTNVPVVYMTCNAAVFEIGDRCVVQFSSMEQENPRVIGFVDNPKTCQYYLYTAQAAINGYYDEGYNIAFVSDDRGNSGFSVSGQLYVNSGDVVSFSAVGATRWHVFIGWSDGSAGASNTINEADISEDAYRYAHYAQFPETITVQTDYDIVFAYWNALGRNGYRVRAWLVSFGDVTVDETKKITYSTSPPPAPLTDEYWDWTAASLQVNVVAPISYSGAKTYSQDAGTTYRLD